MKAFRSKVCGLLLFIAVSFFSLQGFAQTAQYTDTLRVTLPEDEKIFTANNLSLLASHYNIDINKALGLQAKYWDNPVLSTDQNIYDGGWFRHYDGYGQVYVQLSQLIKTAGKRKKLV